jgi:hypothetical protein
MRNEKKLEGAVAKSTHAGNIDAPAPISTAVFGPGHAMCDEIRALITSTTGCPGPGVFA